MCAGVRDTRDAGECESQVFHGHRFGEAEHDTTLKVCARCLLFISSKDDVVILQSMTRAWSVGYSFICGLENRPDIEVFGITSMALAAEDAG